MSQERLSMRKNRRDSEIEIRGWTDAQSDSPKLLGLAEYSQRIRYPRQGSWTELATAGRVECGAVRRIAVSAARLSFRAQHPTAGLG